VDEELKGYFDGKFKELRTHAKELEGRLSSRIEAASTALENRLVESLRDMQTELLRGFESFSTGQGIRLRKVEADQSNLDTSLRARVDVVEARLLQIELRLGKQ
jgi:hypothetical protein